MEDLKSEIPNNQEGGDAFKSNGQNINFVETAILFVTEYGWYLVIVAIVFIYIWKTQLEEQLKRWRQQLSANREVQQYYQNPEKHIAMQDQMSAARRRMQEQNDLLSMQSALKIKEREEQKRLEKIKELERHELGQGTRLRARADESDSSQLGTKKKSKDSGRLRGEYNPLMGSSSGTTYRPNRPDCSSGG